MNIAGVEEAAHRGAAAAQAQAVDWQQRYSDEHQLRLRLEARLALAPPGSAAAAATVAVAAVVAGHAPAQQQQPQQQQQQQQPLRRHTLPALPPSAAAHLSSPVLHDQLSSTASRLESLRLELERDLQQGRQQGQQGQQADGSLALTRLAGMLQACSFLADASARACGAGDDGHSRRESRELMREDSGVGGSGGGGGGDGGGGGRGGGGEEVSLHDDGGGAGVGATAAAAVSVALAQSWAAAAGARPAAMRQQAAVPASNHGGKARFKLVAAVPRSYRQQRRRDADAEGATGGDGDASLDGSSSVGISRVPSSVGALPAAEASAASPGPSPAQQQQQQQQPPGAAFDSTGGLVNLAEAEPSAMDDAQEATWRASGQHLKLQWLSPPSTVLVVFKPVPAVFAACVRAVAWLLRRGGVAAVYVEPGAHAELAPALQQYLDGGGDGDDCGDGPPEDGGGGNARAPAEADLRQRQMHHPVDLRRQLLTWAAPSGACPPAVPCSVGHAVDLIVTLGGDGTVLWTCGLFAAGPVPPLVPFAMGSLGFMTPFEAGRMERVLERVTGVERGVPLMLRHRLRCRIIRGSASSADLTTSGSGGAGGADDGHGSGNGGGSNSSSTATLNGVGSAGGGGAPPSPPPAAVSAGGGGGGGGSRCTEEFVVLNEVVIDRGMTAQLCNLQCYADQSHVTVVQGDGLIVATPTGSTAYNLAAGGSMVHPAVPCFLFTPICPHSLSSRPLVFPEHVTLRVKVPADSRSGAYCSFDGRSRQELRPGDSVLIAMSQWPAPMVCHLDASHDWFLGMREGLCWNMRKQQAGRGQ